jgi:hypothetical protein
VRKTPSVFQRNYDGDRLVRDEVVPGCEWVLAGEGVATRKHDGTCCRVLDGVLWRRHEVKAGKPWPEGFEPAGDADLVTGDVVGWVRVGDGPADRWHREAFAAAMPVDGSYELCGPKVQGNPEGVDTHTLILHGSVVLHDAPRTFDALREYLRDTDIEGLVWHHPDGRMAKIKGRDFGWRRARRN